MDEPSNPPPPRTEYKRIWRQMHVESARASSNASYAKNVELYRERKRERYQREKVRVLAASAADIKACPICQIKYKRKYLRTHMIGRHKLHEADLPPGLMDKIVT